MSLTTQSESVPLVGGDQIGDGCPLIFIGAISVSEMKTTTSGRPETPPGRQQASWPKGRLLAKPTG